MNMNINESREYKAAKELERVLNDYSFNPDRFTAAIPSFHKTLEQSFMRLIIACIKLWPMIATVSSTCVIKDPVRQRSFLPKP